MARLETRYRCPVCNRAFPHQILAMRCREQHPIREETWAVGKGGKAVRVLDNWAPDSAHGVNTALREADLSDDREERKRQLKGSEINR